MYICEDYYIRALCIYVKIIIYVCNEVRAYMCGCAFKVLIFNVRVRAFRVEYSVIVSQTIV